MKVGRDEKRFETRAWEKILAGEKEKAAVQSGSHFQNAFGAERTPSVFFEVVIFNGGRAFGAVAAFVFVLEKVGI